MSQFAELTAIYQRPWPDDPREEWRAWEDALAAGADPAAIIAGARAWVVAFPGKEARFLPALAKFLDERIWTKPPPEKPKRAQRNGKPQRMTPARAAVDLLAEVRGEASL
jgi:hypothetical protein